MTQAFIYRLASLVALFHPASEIDMRVVTWNLLCLVTCNFFLEMNVLSMK